MEISRQECWSREWVAFPFSRGFPDPGIKPGSPAFQADSLLSEPPGKPMFGVLALYHIYNSNYFLTSGRLLFNFVDFFFFFLLCKSFLVWCSSTCSILLLFLVSDSKHHCQDICQGTYHLFSSRSFKVSGLIFKPLIHLKLTFVN